MQIVEKDGVANPESRIQDSGEDASQVKAKLHLKTMFKHNGMEYTDVMAQGCQWQKGAQRMWFIAFEGHGNVTKFIPKTHDQRWTKRNMASKGARRI